MKILVRSFLFLLMMGLVLTSCNNDKKENIENNEAVEHKNHSHSEGAEANDHKDHSHSKEVEVVDHGYEMAMSAYQCPMKCEGDKTYKEEGACPECKMDLKKIEVAENTDSKEETPAN